MTDQVVINKMASDIIDFQNMVYRLSEMLNQKPEEVIRNLVNSRWDIRECLDYKDSITIMEVENGQK